jgi:signal transduction histidine kinase
VEPPVITIQSVSADDKPYEPTFPVRFPAHTSSVQIRYSAVSLSEPEAIHFRYKLRETDKDWHETDSAEPASYRNLAPGSYHFSVDATDTNGVWSHKVATAEFTILPALYQTAWFRASLAAVFVTILWGLDRLRLYQLAREFSAQTGERARIARDLHDTLLQSFQASLIQMQTARNIFPRRPEEAIQTLDNAIGSAEQAIDDGRGAIQDLRSRVVPQSDLEYLLTVAGHDLTEAQLDSNATQPMLDVNVRGTRRILSSILQDEVYRISVEALRNAFHHAQARHIEVEIIYADRDFRLRIRDDGKGIDPNILKEGARAGHYGILGIRERAKRIEGRFDIWSEAGAGTEIELTVPASRAYAKLQAPRRFGLFRKKTGVV